MEKIVSLLPIQTRLEKILFGALVIIILLSAFAFEYTHHDNKRPGFLSVPLDDAWIHFVYAKSLATSLRLDYNNGESQAGFSSMLWVIMLAPFLFLGFPPTLAAKIIGLAAQLALAWYIYLWLRKYCSDYLAGGGAFIIGSTPILFFASLSGMEVIIYALFMVGASYYFFDGKHKTSAVFLAAIALSRPDGIIFIGVFWVVFFIYFILNSLGRAKGKKISASDALLVVALPMFSIMLWVLYCYIAIGRPFPASFYIRAGGADFFLNFHRVREIYLEISEACPFLSHWSKWLLILPGLAFVLYKKNVKGLILFLFPPVFMFLMGGQGLQIIGGTFTGNRYLVPVLPFLVLVQVLGVAFLTLLLLKLFRHTKNQKKYIHLFSIALMILLLYFIPPSTWHTNQKNLRMEFAQSCSNIENMQVAAGKWIAANTPEDSIIATFDAGAIKYLGKRKTIDILGLNSYGIPPEDLTVILKFGDYLVTYPRYSGELVKHFTDKEQVRFVLKENITCADDTMVIYKVH